MPKREVEFHFAGNPWRARSAGNDVQVPSVDGETGAFTRLSRMTPNTDRRPCAVGGLGG